MPSIPMRSLFWLRGGVGLVAGIAVGAAVLVGTDAVYASTASVLVESVGSEVNMQTEAQLVRSTQTATDANARLIGDANHPAKLGGLVDVEAVPGTSVLRISFEADERPRATPRPSTLPAERAPRR